MEIKPSKQFLVGEIPSVKRAKSEGSFLSRLVKLFLGKQKNNEVEGSFQGRPVTLVSQEDLRDKVQKSLKTIDNEEKILIAHGGHLGEAFATRYVEPVVASLRRFVDMANTGMACRLTDVEVVAVSYKTQQLFSKICEKVIQQARQAIAEDVAFVRSFASEVLDESHVRTLQKTGLLHEIQQQLDPIVQKMHKLVEENVSLNTLLDLYQWRVQIDLSRQQLQDAALSIIEDNVQMWKCSDGQRTGLTCDEQLASTEKVFNKISSGEFEWPTSLFELEEASYLLTRLAEREKGLCKDSRVIRLIRDLREDIDVLFETANRSQYHDILLRVMEHLRSVENTVAAESPEEELSPPELDL